MEKKPARAVPSKAKRLRERPEPIAALATGQIWKAGETYVHIKEAGARLIHYKMATTLHRPGLRRHLASIKTVRAYLTSHRAELLTDGTAETSSTLGA